MLGTKIARYQVLEEVGRGGMSVVYRASDVDLDRPVALKVLHEHLAPQAEVRDRFRREAKAVARLHHPNLLEIYDFSLDHTEQAYLVTEFIEGQDLASFLERHRLVIPELGAVIVAEVAAGLAHAHENGVIHRDIKPQNVMLRVDGTVKLTDFGIARLLDQSQMTMTGTLLGSPAHMCPELVAGEPVDTRGDIFSLGTLLYQCVTGKLPFQADNPSAMLHKIVSVDCLPPEALNPAVGGSLSRIIRRCHQRAPADRFPDAVGLRTELLAAAAEVGLDEPEEEIRALLADPDGRQAELRPQVVARLKERGAVLLRKRQVAAALERYDRALALDPEDDEIPLIIDRIARRQRLRQLAGWAGLAVTGLALLALLAWRLVIPAVAAWTAEPKSPPEELAPGMSVDIADDATPPMSLPPPEEKPGTETGATTGAEAGATTGTEAGATTGTAGSPGTEAAAPPSPGKKAATGTPGTGRAVAPADRPQRVDAKRVTGKRSGRTDLKPVSPGARRPVVDLSGVTGQLKVYTDVYAEVWIDGERVGQTPMPDPLTLTGGTHQVELRNRYCRPYKGEVEIREAGQLVELRRVLERAPAWLVVRAPEKARIYVDDDYKGEAPRGKPLEIEVSWDEKTEIERLVKVRVFKSGYTGYDQQVRLTRGVKTPLPVELKPEP